MKKTLSPPGNAVEYVVGINITFVPVRNCRSILAQALSTNADDVKFGGMTIGAGKSLNVDVYPDEQIGGQWTITGTAGDILEIMQLAPE